MSQPASPTRTKRNATRERSVPKRRSLAIARIAPAPAQAPSIAATIGCGRVAHRLHEVAGHLRELVTAARASDCVSGPMISCTSPPEQKLLAGAGEHDGLHGLRSTATSAKRSRKLGVELEGQRILTRAAGRALSSGRRRRGRSACAVYLMRNGRSSSSTRPRCCARSPANGRHERRSAACRARRG